MRIRAAFLAAAVAGSIAACPPGGMHGGGVLLAPEAEAPAEIHAACDLASNRCSRCHPLERVELARVSSPAHWEYYVERMRRQPESSISHDDARIIVRCLVFRSFGEAGLREIEKEATP